MPVSVLLRNSYSEKLAKVYSETYSAICSAGCWPGGVWPEGVWPTGVTAAEAKTAGVKAVDA